MEKAYKFRFYPTKTQITILNCTFGCVRYVYNHFLGLKQELYSKEKKSMSYNQCSKALTVLKQLIVISIPPFYNKVSCFG